MIVTSVSAYWEKENLDKYFPTNQSEHNEAIAMDKSDLVRIHQLIRQRRCFTVLEFGVGFSTIIIADALMKNKMDWL